MEISRNDLGDYVPPIPLTPEGWDLWKVQDVVLLTATLLTGNGNSDREHFADFLDSTTQTLLTEPWKLTSTQRQDKATVVRYALSHLPREAVFSIAALGDLLNNLERQNLSWTALLSMTGANVARNTTSAVKEAIKLPVVAVTKAAQEADQETGGASAWVLAAVGTAAAGVGLLYLGPLILPVVTPLVGALVRRIK